MNYEDSGLLVWIERVGVLLIPSICHCDPPAGGEAISELWKQANVI